MEFEQIIKRLDWLDEEHRKNMIELGILSEKLTHAEGELKVANKRIKELNSELSQYTNVLARIDQFNDALSQQRVEIVKYVDDLNNKEVDKLPEAEKRLQNSD